ncbi:MAG: tetratricopeptide repeat protein [Kiloniellales bacterium]
MDGSKQEDQLIDDIAARLAVAPADERASLLANAPDGLQARVELAQRLIERGAGETAVAVMADSVARAPGSVEALNALGIIHRRLGRHAAAAARFEQALALAPDIQAIRFNLALSLLSQGDLARGWPLYEAGRDPLVQRADPLRRYPFPEWQGEPVAGKRLYLWSEQGVGDVVLFGAMISELQAQGARCTLECDGRLVALLRRSFPGLAVLPTAPLADLGGSSERFDYHAPLGSLGRLLRPRLAAFPPPRAYLRADPRRVAACRTRLAGLGEGRKVGISWFSKSESYDAKSTRLIDWAPLLELQGNHFVNLQYGEVAAELEAVQRALGVSVFDDPEIDKFNDLDGLAALAAACDIVVTVSNVTVPIAGALGKRVLLIVGPETMWYWFQERADSVWHPDARLFRAATPYRWDDALAKVAMTLAESTSTTRPTVARRKLRVRSRPKPGSAKRQ